MLALNKISIYSYESRWDAGKLAEGRTFAHCAEQRTLASLGRSLRNHLD